MLSIMDMIVLACGVYALYAAYVLKNKGKVIKTFLVFKDTDIHSCKDLAAYAAEMSPKLYVLAGTMIADGLVAIIDTYVVSIPQLYITMLVIFIGVLVWYGLQARNAMKKYF